MSQIQYPQISFSLFAVALIILFNATAFTQYRFSHWSTDNGLPQNGVRGIAKTPDGYLWISTFDGLARFDGQKIDTFNKANTNGILTNRFIGVFVDKEGILYARGEDGSLTIYKKGLFSTLTPDKVPDDSISYITIGENGETLFQTSNYADKSKNWYQFTNNEFIFKEKYTLLNQHRVFNSSSGRTWTITQENTTESFQGQKTVYPLDLRKAQVEVEPFEDSKGGLWLGEGKVHRLSQGKIETFDEKYGLIPSTSYHHFWEDTDGSVWFTSSGGPSGGVGVIQYKNGELQFWNKDKGLSNNIYDVLEDYQGGRWFATDEGIYNSRREVIKTFNTEKSTPKIEAYPLYQDKKGAIWVGTSTGLFIYENNQYRFLKPKTDKNSEHSNFWNNPQLSIQSLWEDEQERMWVGLNGAAFTIKNGIAKEIKEAWNSDIFAIQPDRNGNIWLATSKGVLQFKKESLVKNFTVKDGLVSNLITVVFEDSKGRVWFGGRDGVSAYKDGKFSTYSKNEGLPNSVVRSIYEDANGVLWFGTYDEGLIRFKEGKFFNFKKSDGLFSNGVFSIREDRRGNFWISSNQGIYRIKREQLNDFADGKIKMLTSVGYGKSDGMLSIECNGGRQPASIIDKDGKFWFPTQEGIVRVDAEAEIYSEAPPPVNIESATIEREKVDAREMLIVPAGSRNVEILYSAISFDKPTQTKFRYKLEGYDSDWIEADTRRSAFYSYIPPGDYVFRVKAANSDGIWNESGASLKIQTLPLFYQTAWFYLLCISLFFLLTFIIWKYSLYNFKKRELKLTRLVAERTAELNAANEELQFLANSDELTKISNRRRFEKFLKDEWNRAVRAKTKISLLLLDVDHFKLYNDTYGHQAGDDCLKKIAEAVSKTIKRPSDLSARYGGEEFVVGLGDTDEKGAVKIAKNILNNVISLQIPHATSKTEKIVTVSIGVATISPTEGNAECDLIKIADDALYKAKESGRNQFYLIAEFTDENSVLEEQIIL